MLKIKLTGRNNFILRFNSEIDPRKWFFERAKTGDFQRSSGRASAFPHVSARNDLHSVVWPPLTRPTLRQTHFHLMDSNPMYRMTRNMIEREIGLLLRLDWVQFGWRKAGSPGAPMVPPPGAHSPTFSSATARP